MIDKAESLVTQSTEENSLQSIKDMLITSSTATGEQYEAYRKDIQRLIAMEVSTEKSIIKQCNSTLAVVESRVRKRGNRLIKQINELEPQFEPLSDEALRAKTDEFRTRIKESLGNVEGLLEQEQFKAEQDALNEILPEAFAVVREASKRTLGRPRLFPLALLPQSAVFMRSSAGDWGDRH